MRRIKSNERKNGMRYCTFCKPSKIRATMRNQGARLGLKIQLSCDEHIGLLEDGVIIRESIKREACGNDNENLTEADYQTWMRL